MLDEIHHTGFQNQTKRYFFGNLLKKYILSRDVPEYDRADAEGAPKLSTAARYAHDDNWNHHLMK